MASFGFSNSPLMGVKGISQAPPSSAPTNTVAPVISGTQVVGSVLSTTNGTWTGTAPITYTYQWYRGASLISGATSSTYTLVQADAGNTSNITCQVTGTNIVGNATATSNTLAQIFDSDANTFISSASITDSTQKGAINTLCIDLKGYSIWTKMKALYPIVGGSAGSHAVNLKTPGTYNLTFSTGWTHASTGMTPNGTNAFATTFFTPTIDAPSSQNNVHISVYSRTNTADSNWDIGATSLLFSQAQYLGMYLRTAGNLFYPLANVPQSNVASATTANSDSRGLFIANRTASNSLKGFRNNVKLLDNTTGSQAVLNFPIYIGAINNGGSPLGYSVRQLAFSSIGDGLTNTEAANFYTAVQAYQTTLSRNV